MAILSTLSHSVYINCRRGGVRLGGKPPFSDLERNRIYDLKANILKINRTEIRTFFAFAKILSTMDADQLGDFKEAKTGFVLGFLSSEWRF